MLTEDKIKEYIFLAHQSGKQETSGLLGDIKRDIADLKSNYSKRELDAYFTHINEKIDEFRNENNTGMDLLAEKVTYTNGKVKLHTKILLIVGCVVGTMLVMSGSELVNFIKILI